MCSCLWHTEKVSKVTRWDSYSWLFTFFEHTLRANLWIFPILSCSRVTPCQSHTEFTPPILHVYMCFPSPTLSLLLPYYMYTCVSLLPHWVITLPLRLNASMQYMECVQCIVPGMLLQELDKWWVHCKNRIVLVTKTFVMWVAHLLRPPCFPPMYYTITTLTCHVGQSKAQNSCHEKNLY